ncbi:MAG: DUF4105 domain-containing protein [Gammaproteobacteria bacterium]
MQPSAYALNGKFRIILSIFPANRATFTSLTLFFITTLSWFPAYAADNPYLAELTHSARMKHLAERDEWQRLLHYKTGLLPGSIRSQVDAPPFFNSPVGKTHPQAELETTLARFFEPLPTEPDTQHAQCAFIARYQWLKQQLDFDPIRLSEQPCPRYAQWLEALNPAGITLIFPTAYMNSPASMFGHTLLRIDAQGQNDRTRLLAYALNFGAITGNDNGIAFAAKGLFGGYPGLFSVLPYYLKVREYSDLENRDVWEYQLNLTDEEVHRLLRHAWELRGIWFDYFFFDENCSYHLLSLLETARPGLHLTDTFNWWAIPSDTVRAVVAQNGFVKNVYYRPSRREILENGLIGLGEAGQTTVQALATGKVTADDEHLSGFSSAQKAVLLELGYEYANYRQTKSGNEETQTNTSHALLAARSQLATQTGLAPVPTPAARPDQGHATARISLAAGRENGKNFEEINVRPAYHDLLDSDEGYVRGAQINFFQLAARRYHGDGVQLQRFIPVDIVSLSPVSALGWPLSWKVNFGMDRKWVNNRDPLLATLNAGAGLTFSKGPRLLAYGLWETGLDLHNTLDQGYSLGTGMGLGALVDISPRWKLQASGRVLRYGLGERHTRQEWALEQRYSLNAAHDLRLRWATIEDFDHRYHHLMLSWQWFL